MIKPDYCFADTLVLKIDCQLANEDILLPTQMFPRLSARATFVADTNFVSGTQKNVSEFVQKHFVSAKNVSQFAQLKKHHGQQCVRNNVSSFTRAFRDLAQNTTATAKQKV